MSMKKKILAGSIVGFLFLVPLSSFAASATDPAFPPSGTDRVLPPSGTDHVSNKVTLTNPLGNIDSFEGLITAVLDAAFVIGLPIAVLFIVLAGLRFVLARGNQEKLTQAKTNLLYTVIGIAIFFGAWVLAKIIETTVNTLRSGL